MEYKIIGFSDYWVNDNCQVIKKMQTAKGETVKHIPAMHLNKNSEFTYVRLTRRENSKGVRYAFPLDEVVAAAKLGIELGTDESKKALKQYRHEQSLMGRVVNAEGSDTRRQEVINILHADLIRQMNTVGIRSDVDLQTVYVLAQHLFEYFRICSKSSGAEYTLKVTTKNGESWQKNPLFVLRREMFNDVMNGLQKIGLTFEKVVKQLPPTIYDNVATDMFEEQEKEGSRKSLGIVWNE